MRLSAVVLVLGLSGCGIYHAQPIGAGIAPAPQTQDALEASTNCFESATAFEKAVCATPDLAALNRAMVAAYQADMRKADIFARDALLAAQGMWMLGVDAGCVPCLAKALAARTETLRAWQQPAGAATGPNALAQYVVFAPVVGGRNPGFCTGFAHRANAAIAGTGALSPLAMGGTEIAGSQGPAEALDGTRNFSVDLHQANVFGLYQIRARALRIDAAEALGPLALTQWLQAQAGNGGGRFSAYASQTGDYGSIDVFRLGEKTLALVADAWGFDTPAPAGEFAHAGLWDVGGAAPAPLCLFNTYPVPAPSQAASAWRAALTQLRDSTPLPLGSAALRDRSQLRADSEFVVLNMPLLAVQQARSGGWTTWLRKRHDAVLDALHAWSLAAPGNQSLADTVFTGMKGAAEDLVRDYQQGQALSAAEARQAAAVAVMELLYGATTTLAPALGADLGAPGDADAYKPRYPILAHPDETP